MFIPSRLREEKPCSENMSQQHVYRAAAMTSDAFGAPLHLHTDGVTSHGGCGSLSPSLQRCQEAVCHTLWNLSPSTGRQMRI